MSNYKYVIAGGGLAADSAVQGIREVDDSGSIAVFSEEKDRPYNRPPLSKGLWKGDPIESVWRKGEYRNTEIFTSTRITAIDTSEKIVRTRDGATHHYEKLLLATGGRPKTFPFGGDEVIYFRTLEDYRRLRSLTERGSDFVVIGAGFIGSEVAAALTMNGKRVTMIFPEDKIGARVYPKGLASFLVSYYMEKGVNILSGESVKGIEKKDGKMHVKISGDEEVLADAIVAGLGITPNDAIARVAGLLTEDGILVDEMLRTANQDIYAAGDAANFPNYLLGRRTRVEHEDNANMMGLTAGHNMAGRSEPYHHLPFFYSDLFDLGYEAAGDLDSRLDTIEDWEEEFRKGVIYYLRDGLVRGVLLWNTWGKVDAARELIGSGKKHSRESLKSLIRE